MVTIAFVGKIGSILFRRPRIRGVEAPSRHAQDGKGGNTVKSHPRDYASSGTIARALRSRKSHVQAAPLERIRCLLRTRAPRCGSSGNRSIRCSCRFRSPASSAFCLTDLTYWWSADMMWADFSAWLVTVGVIVGLLAAIFGLIDFLGSRLDPRPKAGVAARDRKCRGAHSRDAQHVRSLARRVDLGRAVGPRAFGGRRAPSHLHDLDGTIAGLSPRSGSRRMKSALKLLSLALVAALR